MNKKRMGLECVLVGFTALTAYTVYQHGYIGFFALMMANAATLTAGVDLVIALVLIMVWMGQDARQQGISSLPYVLLTVTLGSVGPLLYLIRRVGRKPAPALRRLPSRERVYRKGEGRNAPLNEQRVSHEPVLVCSICCRHYRLEKDTARSTYDDLICSLQSSLACPQPFLFCPPTCLTLLVSLRLGTSPYIEWLLL